MLEFHMQKQELSMTLFMKKLSNHISLVAT
ncbi:Uncharacterised protein [Vibrio cholerae]|nr:Uncharacterised protein [Vibrio cholerae]